MTSRNITIALYPNAKGFGYAVIEDPVLFLDEGVATIRPISNHAILKRVIQMIEFYRPTNIIVPDYKGKYSSKSYRVKKLINILVEYATDQQVTCYRYSREQIREVFHQFGAVSKYEIALKIIDWFSELETRKPPYRKPWMAEGYYMGMFDAISLIITHRFLTT